MNLNFMIFVGAALIFLSVLLIVSWKIKNFECVRKLKLKLREFLVYKSIHTFFNTGAIPVQVAALLNLKLAIDYSKTTSAFVSPSLAISVFTLYPFVLYMTIRKHLLEKNWTTLHDRHLAAI